MNEQHAVRDIRAVVAAEARYAAANGGYHDSLGCLARPQGCLPGLAGRQLAALDAALATTATRHGYEFVLRLGPSAPPDDTGVLSPSSAVGFAYVATPVQPGVTGRSVFCGDATGVVRLSSVGPRPGVTPTVAGPACPTLWQRMP